MRSDTGSMRPWMRTGATIPACRAPPRGEQMGPVRSSRALGMVMIAMHDAFAAATSGMTPYQVTRTAPAGANAGAAMAAAGYTVLTALCPSQSATLADTWQYYAEDRRPDAASIAFGTLVGNDVLAWRAGDAPFLVESYTPSGLPYDHDVDPLHPGQDFVGSLWGGAPRFLANLQPFAAPPGADASGGFNPDAFYRPARRDRARRGATTACGMPSWTTPRAASGSACTGGSTASAARLARPRRSMAGRVIRASSDPSAACGWAWTSRG